MKLANKRRLVRCARLASVVDTDFIGLSAPDFIGVVSRRRNRAEHGNVVGPDVLCSELAANEVDIIGRHAGNPAGLNPIGESRWSDAAAALSVTPVRNA